MRWDRIRAARRAVFPTARSVLLARDMAQLPLSEFRDVLVVGVGDDPYRKWFRSATQYVRVDLEPQPETTDVIADAHALPFADAIFDCVFASEVFEHLRDPRQFIREATRTLRPAGTVLLTIPFMFHMHGDPFDYWRPTRETCATMFGENMSIKVYGQGNRLHVISDLLTTAGGRWPILYPLRIMNPFLRFMCGGLSTGGTRSTAPSGFVVVATKRAD